MISEVEALDETQGQRYRDVAAASIARHGGRYIVRGAAPEVPEGDWPPDRRVVVVEFPSMQQLQEWYRSGDYAEALATRQTALDCERDGHVRQRERRREQCLKPVDEREGRTFPVIE